MTQDEWWVAFAKVVRRMPKSVELVVSGGAGGGDVGMYPAGSLRARLDRDTGWGMEEMPMASMRCRILPYSEGQ